MSEMGKHWDVETLGSGYDAQHWLFYTFEGESKHQRAAEFKAYSTARFVADALNGLTEPCPRELKDRKGRKAINPTPEEIEQLADDLIRLSSDRDAVLANLQMAVSHWTYDLRYCDDCGRMVIPGEYTTLCPRCAETARARLAEMEARLADDEGLGEVFAWMPYDDHGLGPDYGKAAFDMLREYLRGEK